VHDFSRKSCTVAESLQKARCRRAAGETLDKIAAIRSKKERGTSHSDRSFIEGNL